LSGLEDYLLPGILGCGERIVAHIREEKPIGDSGRVSIPKKLSDANAFEISDIQEDEITRLCLWRIAVSTASLPECNVTVS
jgi:hypothetical protein